MFKNRYVGVLSVIWNVGKADVILLFTQCNTICKIIMPDKFNQIQMHFNYRWSYYNEVFYFCILTTGLIFHFNSAQLMTFEPSSDV